MRGVTDWVTAEEVVAVRECAGVCVKLGKVDLRVDLGRT